MSAPALAAATAIDMIVRAAGHAAVVPNDDVSPAAQCCALLAQIPSLTTPDAPLLQRLCPKKGPKEIKPTLLPTATYAMTTSAG
jgi:hypothetical protein